MKNQFSAVEAQQVADVLKRRADATPSPYEVKGVIKSGVVIDGVEKSSSGQDLYLVTLPGDAGVRKLSLVKGTKPTANGIYDLVWCEAIREVQNPQTGMKIPAGTPALRLQGLTA